MELIRQLPPPGSAGRRRDWRGRRASGPSLPRRCSQSWPSHRLPGGSRRGARVIFKGALSFGLAAVILTAAVSARPQGSWNSIPLRALNIEFCIKDHKSNRWDGSVSTSGGEIVSLGDFSFPIGDVPAAAPMPLLSSKLEVSRVPPVEHLRTGEYEDGYPSIPADRQGNLSVAWIGYRNESDSVLFRRRKGDTWSQAEKVTDRPGDLFGTAVDAQGRTRVVRSERSGGAWRLRSRHLDGSSWSRIDDFTSGAGDIRQVTFIRDNKYIYTRPGTGESMEFTFREPSLDPGEHYYYVRVEQMNKNMAWASPIWIQYR